MIGGLLAMLVANAAILLGSHALVRKAGTGDGPVDAFLFQLFRLLLISALILIAGLTRTLHPFALGGAGVILLAVLFACGIHRTLKSPARLDIGRATALLALFVAVRMLAQVWFFAPYSPDALSYHLPKVAEWVRAGAFTREMGVDLNAPLPAGFELIETWWVVFFHHDALIEMAGVEFAVLAFLAVRVLSLRLGLTSKSAFLAATLYVLTPLFSLQATSCLNDAPVAALILAIAALAAARAHLSLILVPLGMLAGVKATGCFTIPAWILLWFLRRDQPLLKPASSGWAAGTAAVALATGAFWYLRNLAWYGSPLYPVGVIDPLFGQINVQTGPRLDSLSTNLMGLVNLRIYDRATGLGTLSMEVAGWGGLAFAVGAVALIHESRRDPGFRKTAAAFGMALLLVLLMVLPDPWNSRFVLFFPAILCVAAAKLSETLRPVSVLIAAGAVLEFGAALLPNDLPAAQMKALMMQPVAGRSAAAFYDGVPPGDPVGVYVRGRTQLYDLYGANLSRRVVYFRLTPEKLVEEMKRQDVRVILVDRKNRRTKDFDDLVSAGKLRAVGGAYYSLP